MIIHLPLFKGRNFEKRESFWEKLIYANFGQGDSTNEPFYICRDGPYSIALIVEPLSPNIFSVIAWIALFWSILP